MGAFDPKDTRSTKGSRPTGKPRTRRSVTIVLIVVVIAAAICGGLFWKYQTDQAATRAFASVPISVTIPNYDAATDTPVALHVEGNDVNGTYVSQDACATMADANFSLKQGSYLVTAVASPILADGTMFETPDTTVALVVGKSGASVEPTIAFTKELAAADITDEQITASVQMAQSCGMADATAAVLGSKVEELRTAAKEAAQEQASYEASREKYHVSTADYSFDIPEYWWGKVDFKTTEDESGYPTTVVYLKSYPQLLLVSFDVTSQVEGGDVGNSVLKTWNIEGLNGKKLEMWMRNWPWLIISEAAGQRSITDSDFGVSVTQEMQNQLTDLSTGGKYTGKQLREAGAKEKETGVYTSSYDSSMRTYLNSAIIPTVKAASSDR